MNGCTSPETRDVNGRNTKKARSSRQVTSTAHYLNDDIQQRHGVGIDGRSRDVVALGKRRQLPCQLLWIFGVEVDADMAVV